MAFVRSDCGDIVARIAGESSAMDAAAGKIADRARMLARSHVESGAYEASIATAKIAGKKGVTDRAAYTDDPGALSIEYGHTMKDGTRVSGQYIFTKAAAEA